MKRDLGLRKSIGKSSMTLSGSPTMGDANMHDARKNIRRMLGTQALSNVSCRPTPWNMDEPIRRSLTGAVLKTIN